MPQSLPPSNFSQPAKYILHPTDFTKQSDAALAHALRLALTNKAELHLLHVGKDSDDGWEDFPSIRKILASWGLIPQDAHRSAVTALGISIEKVVATARTVEDSIESYCQHYPIDLIVLATAGRHGLLSWLKPSTAEKIADKVAAISIPTLFVPGKCRGCVEFETGKVTMEHVLVPVDHQPNPHFAIERGLRAIAAYGNEQSSLTLLHVGTATEFPEVHLPKGPWKIQRVVRQGNPAAEILASADTDKANLIIMVTQGTHGLLDILRGTTTIQVLHEAHCPVLAVPALIF